MSARQFLGVDVSRETLDRLSHYQDLLAQWTLRINLISKSTIPDIWDRHIVDSAQLFPLLPPQPKHLADFGSGGGLPGLVLAILLAEKNPKTKVSLVESDQRKCAFLRKVSVDLDLKIDLHLARILDIPPLNADVMTARALAPLAQLLEFATYHLAPDGLALLPKGQGYGTEIDDIGARFECDITTIQSLTDSNAQILKVKDIHHVRS